MVFHHVGELVRSTLSDWVSRQSSRSSRTLGEAKVIGALVEFGLDEREVAMEGMTLIDLRMEVGSKKTVQGMVSLATRSKWDLPYQVYLVQYSGIRCP